MTDVTRMTIEDFEVKATRWGADVTLWPSSERATAEALLARSPDALALQSELMAMERDFVWDDDRSLVSDALMERVLADAATVSADRAPAGVGDVVEMVAPRQSWMEQFRALSPVWGTAAASALFGVFVGYMSPAPFAEAATLAASLEVTAAMDVVSGAAPGELSLDVAYLDLEPF